MGKGEPAGVWNGPDSHSRKKGPVSLAEHYHARAEPFLRSTGQARSNVTIDINQRRQLCRIRLRLHFECLRENEGSDIGYPLTYFQRMRALI
jgi:hypothetical protein